MARFGVVFALCAVAVQIVYVLGKDCEWRYFQHYEQKACFPELGDNGCPLRYRCNELTEEYRTTCLHNGVRYKTKEAIRDLSPCDSCRCEMGSHGAASISCAAVDCPDWEPKNKSCYMGFIPGQCCPREMCPAGDKESQKTCYHKGVNYRIGQYIENTEHCTSCICTEQWTDENGHGCSRVNCITGIHAEKIRSGCLPIYLDKGCCAIEMYCDDLYGLSPAISSDKDDLCYYQGQYYERGSVGYLKNDVRKSVTCKCTTPPDFTCVKGTH